MLAQLMVSEKRLRVSMISLSGAPLRMERRPLERDAGGLPDCGCSSSDGMVSAGDGGRAGGAAQEGTCGGGGQGGRGDHNAKAQVGIVMVAEGWVGGGNWSGVPDGPEQGGIPCDWGRAGVAGIMDGGTLCAGTRASMVDTPALGIPRHRMHLWSIRATRG